MINKLTLEQTEQLLGRNLIDHPNVDLHWTDYEDTNLVINLLKNCSRILELGTYLGYTTENLANHTRGHIIDTVDIVKEDHANTPKFQKHELLSVRDSGKMIKSQKVVQHKMTCDEFFAKSNYKWDGIFIDASHDKEDVIRDSYNAINHLNKDGIIVWHDVYNFDNSCAKCSAEPPNHGVVEALTELPYSINKIGSSWIAFLIV